MTPMAHFRPEKHPENEAASTSKVWLKHHMTSQEYCEVPVGLPVVPHEAVAEVSRIGNV